MAVSTVKIIGLEGVMKTLRELPPELVSKRGGPVRAALRKASKLFVDQMKANVQAITDEVNIDGHSYSTGFLQKNIVTTRDSRHQFRGERYIVRVRRKTYPRKSANAKSVNTKYVGALLESGTEKRAPMPWVRPAFDAKRDQILPLFVSEMRRQLNVIERKLARQNGVG